jgi:hypothetical protein
MVGLQNVQPHYISYRIMKDQSEKIEIDYGMQPHRQVVKQCPQIPLVRNRFADFQQGFQLAAREFRGRCKRCFRRGHNRVCHINQNSIRPR